jgi:PKD repeat protein
MGIEQLLKKTFAVALMGIAGCVSRAEPIHETRPVTENHAPSAVMLLSVRNGKAPLTLVGEAYGEDEDGDELSYYWDFGDGCSSNSQFVNHTYTTPNIYLVSVYVFDPRGNAASNSDLIAVMPSNEAPSVSAIVSEEEGKAPLIVVFSGYGIDPEGENLQYYWEFGDGKYAYETQSPVHTYEKPGTYVANLIVSDPEGNSASTEMEINVR